MLSARERIGAPLRLVTGKSEAGQMPLHHSALPLRAQLTDDLEQRSVDWYLRHILPVVARSH